jgi:hypothetical protein
MGLLGAIFMELRWRERRLRNAFSAFRLARNEQRDFKLSHDGLFKEGEGKLAKMKRNAEVNFSSLSKLKNLLN